MKRRIPALAVLALCGLVGCASSSGLPTADDLLAGAHDSLVQDDVDTARVWLGSARQSVETDQQKLMLELLTAEVDLRAGEPAAALAASTRLLEDHPDHPRVHELAGKARIQLGEFSAGSRHFAVAASRYRTDEDRARAEDLLVLSRGLESFADGRVAEAQEQWAAIRDRALRASVMQASGASPPLEKTSGAFANSFQPVP